MTDNSVFDSDALFLESTNLTLLARASSDDQRAWKLLVGLYLPLIYSRVRRRKGFNAQDAENICQEVLTSVARSLPKFRRQRDGSFRNWLYVITDNKCKDFLKKVNVAPAQGGSGAHEIIQSVEDNFDASEDEDNVCLGDKALVMRQAMLIVKEKLKDKKWQIYWDVVVEGRDRRDTAKEYEVSIDTVYNTISRTNRKIKEVFQDLIDDDFYPAE